MKIELLKNLPTSTPKSSKKKSKNLESFGKKNQYPKTAVWVDLLVVTSEKRKDVAMELEMKKRKRFFLKELGEEVEAITIPDDNEAEGSHQGGEGLKD